MLRLVEAARGLEMFGLGWYSWVGESGHLARGKWRCKRGEGEFTGSGGPTLVLPHLCRYLSISSSRAAPSTFGLLRRSSTS